MQKFVDHATSLAQLDALTEIIATLRAQLLATDKAIVFKAGLDAIKKDGEPPLLDMLLSCVGALDYRAPFEAIVPLVAQLAADGKIPAPPDPAVVASLLASADACDAHKGDFANLGQSIRDFLATPGLKDALAAMGGHD